MSAGRTGSSPALYGTGKGIIAKWINACKEIVQYESYFTSSSVAVTLRDPSFRKGPSISAEYCSQLGYTGIAPVFLSKVVGSTCSCAAWRVSKNFVATCGNSA